MSEEWDLDAAEAMLRDAQAVAFELTPTLDESADRFTSAAFEASVTNDGARLVRLVEDAKLSAEAGRIVAALYEIFAKGLELHSMPTCRAAAVEMRQLAEREHLFGNLSERIEGG